MNTQKLDVLQRAIEFLDLCRADKNAGPTGALRDAVQWVESAARDLLADDAITRYYTEKMQPGQPAGMQR
jgi:hypothetical protein